MTSSIQRLGVKQTPWQPDRQQERPWLHNKGGFFFTLLLVTKSWLYIFLCSITSRPPVYGLVQQVQDLLRTGSTTVLGSSTIVKFFKLTNKNQRRKTSMKTLKFPALRKRLFFFSPLHSVKQRVFFLCVTAANVCYLIPISTFLQLLTLPVVLEVSVLPHVALGHFLYLLLFNWQTTTTTNSIQSHRVYHYVLEFHGRMKIFKM